MGIRAKRRQTNLAARFFIFIVVVAALAVAGILAITLLPGLLAGQLGTGSPDLINWSRSVRTGANTVSQTLVRSVMSLLRM